MKSRREKVPGVSCFAFEEDRLWPADSHAPDANKREHSTDRRLMVQCALMLLLSLWWSSW